MKYIIIALLFSVGLTAQAFNFDCSCTTELEALYPETTITVELNTAGGGLVNAWVVPGWNLDLYVPWKEEPEQYTINQITYQYQTNTNVIGVFGEQREVRAEYSDPDDSTCTFTVTWIFQR